MNETFVPVAEWEDRYLVSDRGNVWGLYRNRLVKPQVYRTGYYVMRLCDGQRREVCYIHVMVAQAFIGPRPPGHHVHHRDGDRLNNLISNLEYKPISRHITEHFSGELGTNALLTEEQVREILATSRERGSGLALAEKFGVSPQNISMIRRGKSWSHLDSN